MTNQHPLQKQYMRVLIPGLPAVFLLPGEAVKTSRQNLAICVANIRSKIRSRRPCLIPGLIEKHKKNYEKASSHPSDPSKSQKNEFFGFGRGGTPSLILFCTDLIAS